MMQHHLYVLCINPVLNYDSLFCPTVHLIKCRLHAAVAHLDQALKQFEGLSGDLKESQDAFRAYAPGARQRCCRLAVQPAR